MKLANSCAALFARWIHQLGPCFSFSFGAAGGITGQVGGLVNYIIFSFWIFVSFAGWIVALSSLSALQHYENDTGISAGETAATELQRPRC